MRSFIVLATLCWGVALGWQARISPPASQLDRLATGTDLYLVCQVSEQELETNDGNVEVSWYKDGNKMTKQKIRKNGFIQASLAFVKPTKADSGVYTCKASANGETKEEEASVTFYERAGFVDADPTQHPQDGEDAKITCETKGDRLDEIFWKKDGFFLSEADERGYKFEDDYHTLVIPSFFSEQDDGNYSCNVVQFAQVYTQEITVTAYSRPVITVFEVPPHNYGFEGSDAVFKCQATGKPSPSYKWFKHEEHDRLEELIASDKYKIDNGLLAINYLVESDVGEYTCIAENELGNATQSAELNIHRKPKIARMQDITTVLGNSVELVCEISSDSDVTEAYFTFNKQKYFPSITTTTVAPEVSEEDEDDSEETTAEPSSVEATTPDASAEDDASNEDDDDEETTNYPDNTNEVEDEEQEARRRRRRHSVPMDGIKVEWRDDNLVLTIPSAQMSHMGKYACHAQNIAGTTYDNVKVLITHAPVFTNVSDKLIRRQVGESAFIFCEVSAVPAATLAFHKGSSPVYPDGANVQLDTHTDKLSLSINKLTAEDFGSYKCTAKNSEGTAEPVVFDLIKIVPPKDPESISCTENVYPNYAVCHFTGYSDNRGEWPTEFETYYVESASMPAEDFDWETDATLVQVDFDGETGRIHQLTPSTSYFARFRPVNEVGKGELSDVIQFETTGPWTPERVLDAIIDCPDVCSVNWTAPNDRGSPITSYKLVFKENIVEPSDSAENSQDEDEDEEVHTANASVEEQQNDDGSNEPQPDPEEDGSTENDGFHNSQEETNDNDDNDVEDDEDENEAEEIVVSVSGDIHHVELPQLLPLRNYQLTIYAVNSEGDSDAASYYFRTTEKSGLATLFPLPNWAVILVFVLGGLLLACALDAFCCKTRHCGILACVSSHLQNRRNRIPKDVEQGNVHSENRGLLSSEKNTGRSNP